MIFHFRSLSFLYHIDEHRAYLDEIQAEFHDSRKYSLKHYYSEESYLDELEVNPPPKRDIAILIYGVYFNGNEETRIDAVKAFIKTVKERHSHIEIMVMFSRFDQKIENDLLSIGAYAVFQRNENAFLRITNHVRGIISKKTLDKERYSARFTLRLFFFSILLLIVSYLVLRFFLAEKTWF